MNKIIKYFLTIGLVFTLVGCGGSARFKIPAPMPDDSRKKCKKSIMLIPNFRTCIVRY